LINKYLLRKNFKSTYLSDGHVIYGRMAFKTKRVDWVDTTLPVVALLSVHSAFNEGVDGYFKMTTFLTQIRENVKGNVSILFADTAHLHTLRLAQLEDPLIDCLRSAKELALHYDSYIDSAEVLYWSSYIMADEEYGSVKEQLQQLIQTDDAFKTVLLTDAEAAYTEKREKEFPNKELFIEKMIDDLIEQCVCIQILAKKGYRYLLYPGAPCESTEYINRHYTPLENYLHWVDVFVTIEKKTKIFHEKFIMNG